MKCKWRIWECSFRKKKWIKRGTASRREWRVRSGKWKRFTPSERGGKMSIEIEVGLENATKAPRITEEELRLEETPKGLANPKVQRLVMGGGAVVVATIVG